MVLSSRSGWRHKNQQPSGEMLFVIIDAPQHDAFYVPKMDPDVSCWFLSMMAAVKCFFFFWGGFLGEVSCIKGVYD